MQPLAQLAAWPDEIAPGASLAVGTYWAAETAGGGFVVVRQVGAQKWFALVEQERPAIKKRVQRAQDKAEAVRPNHRKPARHLAALAWRLWPSRQAANDWIESQGESLCEYPYWGR